MRAAQRRRRWRRSLAGGAAGAAVVAACVPACSSKTIPAGGLVVVMNAAPALASQSPSLRVWVGAVGRGKTYWDRSYGDKSEDPPLNFPATLAMDASGDTDASVSFELTLRNGSQVLDDRSYDVKGIPSDRVVELDVYFDGMCSMPCSQTWDGQSLPTYPQDAGIPAPPVDATAPPEVGTLDSAQESAADGSDASLDAPADALLDAPADAPHEAAAEAGADAPPDAPPDAAPCMSGDHRCNGNVPQGCDANGRWVNGPDCILGMTHCSGSGCVPVPPSCATTTGTASAASGAGFDCGADGTHDCCASYDVPGGDFVRVFDNGVTSPATISTFRLDAFEVTVGRYRQFVTAAVRDGWFPGANSGTHAYLPGGLTASGDAGAHETGWDLAWNANLPATKTDWDNALECLASGNPPTWTPDPGAYERVPIECLSWYEAYAFCIWDGGFLPSSAEWSYAAEGGADGRVYAWGNTKPGPDTQLAIYGCNYGGTGYCSTISAVNIAPVGSAPMGNGKWGQSDLTGNVWEYVLDTNAAFGAPCHDCATVSGGAGRLIRGAAFDNIVTDLVNGHILYTDPAATHGNVGFRCARAPAP